MDETLSGWLRDVIQAEQNIEHRIINERPKHVIPYNPDAALTKYIRDRGGCAQSPEVDTDGHRWQAFTLGGKEYVAYCRIPDWHVIKVIEL